MGISIFNYRIGEMVFFFLVLFLLVSIFTNPINLIQKKIWSKKIRFTLFLLLSYFLFSVFFFKGSLSDLNIYRTSSFIWAIGFLYLSMIIFEKRKPTVIYLSTLIAMLIWIYVYNIYGVSDEIQNFLLILSDKFEYHKGSDLLIMFVATFFVANRIINNKRIAFEIFIVYSFLYLPILLFKSRTAFLAFFIFFILEIIYFKQSIKNQPKRNFFLFIASLLILVQSIFIVTKSGYIQIEDISTRAEIIIDYRLTTDSQSEESFIYIKDGILYSTDGNLNWRLQIWQDVLFDLAKTDRLLTGYGFSSTIPAMEDPLRKGGDGTNENVHNFLVNILARGGVISLFLYGLFFFFLLTEIIKKSNNFEVLNLIVPIFITSLFDASMENAHFPLLLYGALAFYIQNLSKD